MLAVTAAMVVSFRVTAANVERRERLRSAAIALIEEASKAARNIDCVQNAYVAATPPANSTGLQVCGPAPAGSNGTEFDINGIRIGKTGKVVKPAGLTTGLSDDKKSGHALITIEWADYYHLDSMSGCTSADPPRAAREITATWRDGAQGDSVRKLTRTVLGPSVLRTRGWTAKQFIAPDPAAKPARDKYSYVLSGSGNTATTTSVQVPTYKPHDVTDSYCKVLVARVGNTSRTVGGSECVLKEGWNNPPSGCL